MSATTSPLGGVYGEALAEAAEERGALVDVGSEVDAIAREWERERDVRTYFLSGAIPKGAKSTTIERVFRGKAHDLTVDFLQVLLERGRLPLLPDAALALARILDTRSGRVRVVLQTASEVSPNDVLAWRARIQSALGKEPVLTHQVRPALIGGAVLRIGDVVADGSVRRRLADLKTRALEASASAAKA